mmetsp:Transcript_54266/g.173973  ORF Transcript_54266/g.173973 Transcript_54266/m.173973 type:complete len:260 (-) Transcript_54266:446-1225(-)
MLLAESTPCNLSNMSSTSCHLLPRSLGLPLAPSLNEMPPRASTCSFGAGRNGPAFDGGAGGEGGATGAKSCGGAVPPPGEVEASAGPPAIPCEGARVAAGGGRGSAAGCCTGGCSGACARGNGCRCGSCGSCGNCGGTAGSWSSEAPTPAAAGGAVRGPPASEPLMAWRSRASCRSWWRSNLASAARATACRRACAPGPGCGASPSPPAAVARGSAEPAAPARAGWARSPAPGCGAPHCWRWIPTSLRRPSRSQAPATQ